MTPTQITYTGAGGYPSEQERANTVFTKGQQYLCIGGSMGQSMTYLQFEGIKGSWNSALFDVDVHALDLPFPYMTQLGTKR